MPPCPTHLLSPVLRADKIKDLTGYAPTSLGECPNFVGGNLSGLFALRTFLHRGHEEGRRVGAETQRYGALVFAWIDHARARVEERISFHLDPLGQVQAGEIGEIGEIRDHRSRGRPAGRR